MWPYVVLVILPLVIQHMRISGATLYIAKPTEGNNAGALKLFFILLLLMLVLRHETVGVDVKNYKVIFEYIAKSSWERGLARSAEVAYSAMNKIISLLAEDFWWILMICAVLSVGFMADSYIKYSNDAGLTIALFVTMTNFILLFSGLRQAIAISLGFAAFEFVRQKKPLKFVLIVAFSILVHTSAFMLIFMYPLYHVRITKKWLLWIIPALVVLFVFNRPIFGSLTMLLSMFTKYDAEISSTGAYMMLILFSLLAIFAYVIPDDDSLDADTIGMRNFLLLSVALQMFAPLHNLAMRMNYYYMAFIPLVIPRIIRHKSKTWGQVATVARHVMVLFFMVYFFVTAPEDNYLQTFPYHFFWENVR